VRVALGITPPLVGVLASQMEPASGGNRTALRCGAVGLTELAGRCGHGEDGGGFLPARSGCCSTDELAGGISTMETAFPSSFRVPTFALPASSPVLSH